MAQLLKKDINFLLVFTASLLLLVWGGASGLAKYSTYWARDEYSHGYLIPFVAFFIGWHRMSEKRPIPRPSGTGLLVLLGGFCLSIVASLSAFEALVNYAFLLALIGFVWVLLGRAVVFALLPAFLCLFFATPLPHVVYGNLSIQMQLWSSTLGVLVLHLFGFSVFQDGNLIDLGHIRLQVAEACNGLRYLFPLACFSYIAAFLLKDRMWKRVVVFLSAAPIAIIMNALRITAIGIMVDFWGQSMAEGFIHLFEGYVVFILCLFLLVVEIWALLKIKPSGYVCFDYVGFARGPLLGRPPYLGRASYVGAVLCLGFALLMNSSCFKGRVDQMPYFIGFSSFPQTIGAWTGKKDVLSVENLKTLKLTDYWLADYGKADEHAPVNFYMAYYATQHVGANIHVPLNCIIGGGWEVEQQDNITVPLAFGLLPVTRLIIRKENTTAVVYYWVYGRGRVTNSQLLTKMYMFIDAITKQRSDGTLVRLTTRHEPEETQEETESRMLRFLSVAYPVALTYMPN